MTVGESLLSGGVTVVKRQTIESPFVLFEALIVVSREETIAAAEAITRAFLLRSLAQAPTSCIQLSLRLNFTVPIRINLHKKARRLRASKGYRI